MSDNFETVDVEGIGAVRARKGTSTLELAGAAKFWQDKAKHAWRDGFLSACIVCGIAATVFTLVRTFY